MTRTVLQATTTPVQPEPGGVVMSEARRRGGYVGSLLIPAVSAVVRDALGRYLLVLRSAPPESGAWTLPGGRVEPGETLRDAVAREVREETGLRVRAAAEAGVASRAAPDGRVFEIHCFTTEPSDGEPEAGSDAAQVRWVAAGEFPTLNVTLGLLDDLRRWHLV